MKTFVAAVTIAVLAAGSASAGTEMTPAGSGDRCLWATEVDHTHVVDQSNILFYMRDGKVWHASLRPACVNLKLSGFRMVGHPDRFCARAQMIEVLNGGATCQIQEFAPHNDKAKQAS